MNYEKLTAQIKYDPVTGVFERLDRKQAGGKVGWVSKTGYLYVSVSQTQYKAHRLAWFLMTGSWPNVIDHIDGNKTNNVWSNLRNVTQSENIQNLRAAHRDSSTGYLGVVKAGTRFTSRIMTNGKSQHLGMFNTAEEAHSAYVKAKRELHSTGTL